MNRLSIRKTIPRKFSTWHCPILVLYKKMWLNSFFYNSIWEKKLLEGA